MEGLLPRNGGGNEECLESELVISWSLVLRDSSLVIPILLWYDRLDHREWSHFLVAVFEISA